MASSIPEYMHEKWFSILVVVFLTLLPIVLLFSGRKTKLGSSDKWIPIPPATEIISLRIYPVKSCRGIEVSSARLLKTGLDLDRNWMFIDSTEHKFQTIRQQSQMTLINTAIDWKRDELILSINQDNAAKIVIPAHPSQEWLKANTTLMTDAKIWADTVDAYVYSESLTKPFGDFLGKDIRLVYKGPTPRILRGNAAPALLGRTQSTKFPDLSPVLVANIRSLDELNQRLLQQGENAITVERFRPNIVVAGPDAWGEDVWKTIKISEREVGLNDSRASSSASPLVLDVTARCARCQVPNVDPETAVKNKKQPWNTLMSYRRVDPGITFKPCFGMLCCPRDEGLIKVGGKLEVTEVTGNHVYARDH